MVKHLANPTIDIKHIHAVIDTKNSNIAVLWLNCNTNDKHLFYCDWWQLSCICGSKHHIGIPSFKQLVPRSYLIQEPFQIVSPLSKWQIKLLLMKSFANIFVKDINQWSLDLSSDSEEDFTNEVTIDYFLDNKLIKDFFSNLEMNFCKFH